MKKVLLLLVLAALAPLFAAAQNGAPYLWQAGGLNLNLPKGWTAKPAASEAGQLKLGFAAPGGMKAMLTAKPGNASNLSGVFRAAAKSAGLDATEDAPVEETLNTMPAVYAELYSPESAKEVLGGYVSAFAFQGKVYAFVAYAPESVWSEQSSEALDLAASIRPPGVELSGNEDENASDEYGGDESSEEDASDDDPFGDE